MSGALIYVPNPLAPSVGLRAIGGVEGLTIGEAIARADLHLPARTLLVRDGELVRRSHWDLLPIRDGEAVQLIVLPHGGGGGGSQILRVIATIAIMVTAVVLAPYLAPILAEATGLSLATATTIAEGAISIGGQLLLSALMPPPKPFSSGKTPSPTYSLSAQGNMGRLGEAIPELFGMHIIYPDLAAAPYSEFDSDNNEIVYQLFCAGQGDYVIHQIRVAENAVWQDGDYTGSYPEIEIEIVPPGSSVTLFPDDVVTSPEVSSIELKGTDEDGYGWSGPYVANGAATLCNYLGIDIALPGGLYHTSNKGHMERTSVSFSFQAQKIDAAGAPLGAWFDLLDETLHMATRDPLRQSYRVQVDPGRYQVRGERTNARGDSQFTNQTYWTGLKAYLVSDSDYSGLTMIAVRAVATNHLNGEAAQKFNVIMTRKLPAYNPDTQIWADPAPTRSAAAAASYLMRAANGMALADNRIDLATLWSIDTTLAERADYFDGVFDTKKSAWESLQSIMRVGRTRPVMIGSTISFVRDEPKTVPVTAFSPRNMLPNSFSIDYVFHDDNSPDALLAIFIDARTWTQNQILCALPGSMATEDDAPQLQIFGMVDREHVWRETIYQVAASFYRRAFPNFRTELEGRVCAFGDLVTVSHWLAAWGASADVIALEESDDGDLLTLSEPWILTLDDGAPPLVASILTPDGRVYGPVEISIDDDGSTTRQARIRLAGSMDPGGKYAGLQPRDWPVWDDDGLQFERPRIMLGTAEEVSQDCLVLSGKPDAGNLATLACVIDDPQVHEADQGDIPVETNPPQGAVQEDLTITAVTMMEVTTDDAATATAIAVSVSGAPDATFFSARTRWDPADDWSNIPGALDRSFQMQATLGTLYLEVRATGKSGAGDWFDAPAFTADGVPDIAMPDITGMTTAKPWVSGSTGEWKWDEVFGATSYSVIVEAKRFSGDPWTQVRSASASTPEYIYQPTFELSDGGPFVALRIGVKADDDASGATSPDWIYSDASDAAFATMDMTVAGNPLAALLLRRRA